MRILLIHNEARYFAGAEKVLGYYLEGFSQANCEITVATVQGSPVAQIIPPSVRQIWIPAKQQFSIRKLCFQVRQLLKERRRFPFDLVHGWTARDWELASLVGHVSCRPSLGTLHDHPRAKFIFPKRQLLMRCCARYGLRRVVCVSRAVSDACMGAGYQAHKLDVVHNGLPDFGKAPNRDGDHACHIGFLGAFSERKGLLDLFLAFDELGRICAAPWQAMIAGAAQDAAGEHLLATLRQRFCHKHWWSRIQWRGWVANPMGFLRDLDLLVVPSSEFDPFPTVLLEAGGAGLPVLAARVGGVDEIVIPGKTGWLFERGDWRQAAEMLNRLIIQPDELRIAGSKAFERVNREFTVGKMVANYLRLYSALVR